MEKKEIEVFTKAFEQIQSARTDIQRTITYGKDNRVCLECGRNFYPRKFEECPNCGSTNSKKLRMRRECRDCGLRWEAVAENCPFCNSKKYELAPNDYPHLESLRESLEDLEKHCLAQITHEVAQHPLWKKFGQYIKGFGLTSWAIIYARTDITKCENLSKFYSHIGFGLKRYCEECKIVFTEERCPKCNKEVPPTVQRKHKGVKLDYDKKLQSRFILVGKNLSQQRGYYYGKYLGFKQDMSNLGSGHAHNRAFRNMIKLFAAHLYQCWREVEGLPATMPYQFAGLGHSQDSFIPWQEVGKLEKAKQTREQSKIGEPTWIREQVKSQEESGRKR